MKVQADGCHVFAGGFSYGVREVMEVPKQYEIHGLGRKTVEAEGIGWDQAADWTDWGDKSPNAAMLFGNPRCTGFSCVTAGYDESAHGAWSKPTKDIHQLCDHGIKQGYDLICWESVQQAMTVGRELLDYLRDEKFVPAGYRIAHLLINAASFGNSQHRKRYFFMAYKADKNFNILPPDIVTTHATVGDILAKITTDESRVTASRFNKNAVYDDHTRTLRGTEEERFFPHLPQGIDLNVIGRHYYDWLEKRSPIFARQWNLRTSDMPFSMHGIYRLDEFDFMPVISGSAGRFVHPTIDRTLTMGELSLLMGWPKGVTPKGDNPVGQIGKGVCPEVGKWLAEMAMMYINDDWGKEDWESSYDDQAGMWIGKNVPGQVEKTFDMTRYAPARPIKREKEERLALAK